MNEVICIGDATLDVFLGLGKDEASLHCRLDREECELGLKYGQKIPVDSVDFSLGGNASNGAVGLKRLGFEVGLFSRIGNDEIGSIVQSKLKAEGLSSTLVQKTVGASAHSTIINFKGERTILEKRYPHNYELPKNLPETNWLYLSSVGPNYEKFFGQVAEFVKKNNLKLAYNPAQTELRADFKTYESILAVCEILFVNKEEAGQMLGKPQWTIDNGQLTASNAAAAKEILQEISRLGPKIVVMTDGRNGSYASDGLKFYHSDIFPVEVVEATGAGDAYASGFLGALMSGQNLKEAMRWGTVNAASVATKVGAVAGLLSKKEIEQKIKERPDFVVKEMS